MKRIQCTVWLIVIWLSLLLTGVIAHAQTPPEPEFVAGEVLLTTRAGVLMDKVREMAQSIDAEFVPIVVTDTYILRLRNRDQVQLKAETLQAVEALKKNPDIRWVRPNWIKKPLDTTPNDPLYGQQWALPMINMPKAWDIQKGKAGVRIAYIDDNFDVDHPDLSGRYDLNLSRDFRDPGNPGNNPRPGPGVEFSHGTGTSSVAIAKTDNGLGMAGVCWEGVQVVAIACSDTGGFPQASLNAAYQYVRDNATQIDVVNMSLGGYFADPQEEQLLREASQRGVILVASAGNNGWDTTQFQHYPSGFPFVISVSALAPDKSLASYSNYGKVELTAPGGDILRFGTSGGIMSALMGGGYYPIEGTSFSAPHVAAAAAMLVSHNVARAEVQDILQRTADTLGTRPPTKEFGYGLINVYNALRGAGVFIIIDSPEKGSTFETLKVRIRAELVRAKPDTITVKIDDNLVPDSEWRGSLQQDPRNPNIHRLDFVKRLTPGRHEVVVSAASIDDETITGSDTATFLIQPHRQFGGLNLFSIAYGFTGSWEDLFGVDFAIARWVPDPNNPPAGRYARYFGSGEKDPYASPVPPDADEPNDPFAVRPDGQNNPTPPRGIGYFLSLPNDTFIQAENPIELTSSYVIPLQPGWNMVGNPYPFAVDWGACEVEITGAGGLRQRITLQDAIDQQYLRGQIYRYVPITGEYTWQTAPLGQFRPWSGHWLRALKSCLLIVPPLESRVRSVVEGPTRAMVNDGWVLRLIARSGEREDRNNFIGVSRSAQDTLSKEDVEKPPLWQSFVSLRILQGTGSRGQGVALAQDLRRSERRSQTWEVEVVTDQPNKEVTLQWSQEVPFPKGLRLTLHDLLSGQRIAMNSQSAYTFRTDERATPRRFRITMQPTPQGRLFISDVKVSTTRGRGVPTTTINYTLVGNAINVQVDVLSGTGKRVARLNNGSRSAGVNTVTWNGRTDSGIALPAGAYSVQITATSDDGEVVRRIVPVVIPR